MDFKPGSYTISEVFLPQKNDRFGGARVTLVNCFWQRTKLLAVMAGLIFAVGACDSEMVLIKPYEGEYAELKGKTILVYFANDSEELRNLCEKVVDSPWRMGGCAGIGINREETLRMRENFSAAAETGGTGIDCILIVPTNRAVLVHELSLCATLGREYWNKNVKNGDGQ